MLCCVHCTIIIILIWICEFYETIVPILSKAKKIYWASTPGHCLGISAQLTNKNTTVLLNMTNVGLTQLLYWPWYKLGSIQMCPHVIFRWFASKLFHWLGRSYTQLNQECQYSGIFESLAVIGWLCKDLYPVSLYIDKERGLAEDFCKLWYSQLWNNIWQLVFLLSSPLTQLDDTESMKGFDKSDTCGIPLISQVFIKIYYLYCTMYCMPCIV